MRPRGSEHVGVRDTFPLHDVNLDAASLVGGLVLEEDVLAVDTKTHLRNGAVETQTSATYNIGKSINISLPIGYKLCVC